jgi:hypothetical protein
LPRRRAVCNTCRHGVEAAARSAWVAAWKGTIQASGKRLKISELLYKIASPTDWD